MIELIGERDLQTSEPRVYHKRVEMQVGGAVMQPCVQSGVGSSEAAAAQYLQQRRHLADAGSG